MNMNTSKKTDQSRSERLMKRRQELQEAMRKDILAVKKIIASPRRKKESEHIKSWIFGQLCATLRNSARRVIYNCF